jgi:hypothetical protein
MFWGWYSIGGDGVRRNGGGCFFLPFLLLCGSFYLFDSFNSRWLLPVLLIGLLWFVVSAIFNSKPFGEKPKRDLEKPKRTMIVSDEGEFIEIDEDERRYR